MLPDTEKGEAMSTFICNTEEGVAIIQNNQAMSPNVFPVIEHIILAPDC